MLILDKRRAIERIVALTEARAHAASGIDAAPPKGARQRIAAYRPRAVVAPLSDVRAPDAAPAPQALPVTRRRVAKQGARVPRTA